MHQKCLQDSVVSRRGKHCKPPPGSSRGTYAQVGAKLGVGRPAPAPQPLEQLLARLAGESGGRLCPPVVRRDMPNRCDAALAVAVAIAL